MGSRIYWSAKEEEVDIPQHGEPSGASILHRSVVFSQPPHLHGHTGPLALH